MRLLFVIDSLGSGGAQRQMVSLASGLARRNHKVQFFLYYPEYNHFAPVLKAQDIVVNASQKRGRFSSGPILALRRLMTGGHYDAALAFLATPSFYAEVARMGLQRLPLVVSERSTYTARRLSVGQWLLQQAHRLADHITVNSHHQRQLMERLFPWMRHKISTIYNGVDLDAFRPSHNHALRPAEGLTLLVLSSVVPEKNAIGLMRGIVSYRQRYGRECYVHWAGKVGADLTSQHEYHQAQRLLRELGLSRFWEWLGERRDVPELLRRCDALIHPSLYEGLPNAICEALACGRPVLAGDVGDHRRLLGEGQTGLLFEPTDPEDIAETIHRFSLLSVSQRCEMGARARQFAEEKLSLERYAREYEGLFERLSAQRPR